MGGRRLRYRWRHRSYDGYLQLPSQSLRSIADTDRNPNGNGNSDCNPDGNGNSYCDCDSYCNSYADCDGYTCSEGNTHTKASTNAAAKAVTPKLARLSPAAAGRRQVIGIEVIRW